MNSTYTLQSRSSMERNNLQVDIHTSFHLPSLFTMPDPTTIYKGAAAAVNEYYTTWHVNHELAGLYEDASKELSCRFKAPRMSRSSLQNLKTCFATPHHQYPYKCIIVSLICHNMM